MTQVTLAEHQKIEHARKKALPIALIQRPLRQIAKLTNYEFDWKIARILANRGQGDKIQELTRRLLAN